MTEAPRARVGGAPMCPNCKGARGLAQMMKGPVAGPNGRSGELFFVCDRCNHTMKDRRSARRETPK